MLFQIKEFGEYEQKDDCFIVCYYYFEGRLTFGDEEKNNFSQNYNETEKFYEYGVFFNKK